MKGSEKPISSGALDLELPDWSGMDRFSPRISTATAFQLNGEYVARYFTSADLLKQWQQREKCEVEFVL